MQRGAEMRLVDRRTLQAPDAALNDSVRAERSFPPVDDDGSPSDTPFLRSCRITVRLKPDMSLTRRRSAERSRYTDALPLG